jgi:hypothetical protein
MVSSQRTKKLTKEIEEAEERDPLLSKELEKLTNNLTIGGPGGDQS